MAEYDFDISLIQHFLRDTYQHMPAMPAENGAHFISIYEGMIFMTIVIL